MASCRACLPLWLLLALSAPAGAVETSPLDTFAFRVGGLVTRFDTTISSREDDGTTEHLDFDRELGLQDRKLIESLAISGRPAQRHEIGLDYFNESLSGTRRLARDVRFQGETFPLATTVHSDFTLEAFEFHYTYWPVLHEHWALGMRFGFVDYRVRTRLRMLLGEQGEPPDVRVEAILDDDIPAPTFGLDLRIAPTSRWRFSTNVGWFEAEFKTVSPVIITVRSGVEFFLRRDLGLWVDYGMSHLDAAVHSSSFDGGVEIYEGGLRVGVIWRM